MEKRKIGLHDPNATSALHGFISDAEEDPKIDFTDYHELFPEQAPGIMVMNPTCPATAPRSYWDKMKACIEGNPDTIKTVNDVWRFAKNMWSQDPTWYLVDTSSK